MLLAVVALVALSPRNSDASIGASVTPGVVELAEKLERGARYNLPPLTLKNPGTVASTYALVVSPPPSNGRQAPDEAWFSFSPRRVTLPPGATAAVQWRITIPASADPARYEALVGPRIVSSANGATVSGGAAARVTFEVRPSSTLQAWWLAVKRTMSGWMPYPLVALGIGGLVALIAALRRSVVFSVQRR